LTTSIVCSTKTISRENQEFAHARGGLLLIRFLHSVEDFALRALVAFGSRACKKKMRLVFGLQI
jgi:hypothetical protein